MAKAKPDKSTPKIDKIVTITKQIKYKTNTQEVWTDGTVADIYIDGCQIIGIKVDRIRSLRLILNQMHEDGHLDD